MVEINKAQREKKIRLEIRTLSETPETMLNVPTFEI